MTDVVEAEKKLAGLEHTSIWLEPVDPFSAMNGSIGMVSQSFPECNIDVSLNFGPNQLKVLADDFLIDVFYNLLHNSARLGKSE